VTSQPPPTVLIFGAGLTGLAVGHFLMERGHHITLLDLPGWQDGYGIDMTDPVPILFGCYRETRRLLHAISNGSASQADRTIPLEFRLPDGKIAAYQSVRLPGALQWVTGLFGFQGLSRHDRWKLLSYIEQVWEQAQTLPADLDNRLAHEWLVSIGQSQEACNHVWHPLSLWLTGNPLAQLSAAVFVRHLSRLFLGQTSDARLSYLHGTIQDRWIHPLKRMLERQGFHIQLQAEEPTLQFGPAGISGVRLQDGSTLHARWYIAALPHRKLLSLLPEHLLTRYAYFAQMGELDTVSDITACFTLPSTTPAPRLLLCADQPFHQLMLAPSGPHEIRCRLSTIANPTLAELRDDQLLDIGCTELRLLCPDATHNTSPPGQIVRHEQAALSLKPGTALRRPIQQSPVQNLLIAGAWTDTGWPSTIESAIVSARRCAEIISSHNDR